MLTFALGGKAPLTPRAFARHGPPTPAITVNAITSVIHEGQILYTANCASVSWPRRRGRSTSRSAGTSTRQVHEQFEAIVLGGARATLGMPPFKDLLKPDQVKAIQAYVLSRAQGVRARARRNEETARRAHRSRREFMGLTAGTVAAARSDLRGSAERLAPSLPRRPALPISSS
jgi:hypothetical protein